MRVPMYLTVRVAACLSAALLTLGCSSSDARARDALGEYQAAAAANNIPAARKALLDLVQAKDDVPDYWIELGKLQASTGNFNEAYYAFTRAYELDRSNVDVLRAVTELALRAGDLTGAQSHADELSVAAPGDPWVKLTTGWAAVTELHYDQALAAADSLLANSPYDAAATVLKARALVGLNRSDEATALLTKQVAAQPSDVGSLRMLERIYERQGDWANLAATAEKLSAAIPSDQDNALLLIQAAFRAGNTQAGRQESLKLLQAGPEPSLVASVLDLWFNYWPSDQRVRDAISLAAHASSQEQKLAYASFLSRVGSPADAIRLAAPLAALPVKAENAQANAVLADGLARMGKLGEAKSRFDAVIAFDPGNATALRGRAELELRTGQAGAAVVDAQKLVTVLPNSARDRLLLARSYAAAGQGRWADRTLWTAFQDIQADPQIYAALLASRKGNPDATQDLQEEFDRQRDAKLSRGLL